LSERLTLPARCHHRRAGHEISPALEPPIGAVPGVGLVVGDRAQNRAFELPRVLRVAVVAGG
jgi:hypothetical protein